MSRRTPGTTRTATGARARTATPTTSTRTGPTGRPAATATTATSRAGKATRGEHRALSRPETRSRGGGLHTRRDDRGPAHHRDRARPDGPVDGGRARGAGGPPRGAPDRLDHALLP